MALPRALFALLLIAFAQSAACTDPGVIGELDPCERGCTAGSEPVCETDEDCFDARSCVEGQCIDTEEPGGEHEDESREDDGEGGNESEGGNSGEG